MGGDADAAIEVLVAEEGPSDQIVAEDEYSPSLETSYGNGWRTLPLLTFLTLNPIVLG